MRSCPGVQTWLARGAACIPIFSLAKKAGGIASIVPLNRGGRIHRSTVVSASFVDNEGLPSQDEIKWRDNLSTAVREEGNDKDRLVSDDLSLLSWNILTQSFADNNPTHYPGIQPWEERVSKIIGIISDADADVVFLQEVSPTTFDAGLLLSMKSAGYDGEIQETNKGAEHAVATFWKRHRFVLREQSSRSRSMIAVLEDTQGQNHLLATVNCHLEGAPFKPMARLTQLSHSLREVSMKYSHHALVLGGDFNCELHDSACSAYLSVGSCPSNIREWGRVVPHEAFTTVPPNPYDLVSTYPPELGRDDRFRHFSFMGAPNSPVAGLDQIWYTLSSMKRVGLKRLFPSDEHRRAMLEFGIPNDSHPSDHVPIGCVLRWRDHDCTQLHDLKHQEIRHEQAFRHRSASDLLAEANELLDACPFPSKQQRVEFDYVVSRVSGMSLHRRPTDEQLSLLNDRHERRDRLLEQVSDETRQILQRILRLRREAEKKISKGEKREDKVS